MASTTVAPEPRDTAREEFGSVAGNRWIQLICGVVAMIVISNYQYAFTLFTPGMRQTFTGVPYAKIAAVFSAFILFETWPMPVAGYFVDKLGIRKLMTFGALCILLGWVLGGTIARSPFDLYLYYGVIAGTGAGIIYISCVANAVKWFPDRRGLAVGLTAAGFGGGAALTIMPIASTIHSMGWAHAMAVWGIAQGIIAFVAALILRHPPANWAPAGWNQRAKQVSKAVVQSKVNFTWTQTLRRPEFYLLYTMFFFACAGGLIATANLSQIAKTLNVSNAKVWGLAIVPLTATLAAAFNALSRIIWGSVSDRLGRERTMFMTFGIEAVLVFLVTKIAGSPVAFVVLFSFVFLFWGEIYSLFSATTGDVFGAKNASANYGMVYTAKGLASVYAGFGAAALAAYLGGSFAVPFYISAVMCAIAALFSLFILKPMVRSRIAGELAESKALDSLAAQVNQATAEGSRREALKK
ncbi:MAG TPA: oxalate/formate MFS antiporter [Candidatus Bathyarchaeia archaeon]|nr:oxalate/formate MFS antiporter [Candidatus Bathyarchaeia archaeon]